MVGAEKLASGHFCGEVSKLTLKSRTALKFAGRQRFAGNSARMPLLTTGARAKTHKDRQPDLYELHVAGEYGVDPSNAYRDCDVLNSCSQVTG